MRVSSFAVSASFTTLLALDVCAASQELVITDCDGATLAAASTQEGEVRPVTFELAYPADSQDSRAELVITNADTGQRDSRESRDANVTFEGLLPGTWQACVAASNTSIKEVVIGEETSSTTGIIAGVAGAGGVTALALGLSGGSGSGSDSVAQVPVAAAQTEGLPAGAAAAQPITSQPVANRPLLPSHPCAAAVKGASSSRECFTNETPTPLSPFY